MCVGIPMRVVQTEPGFAWCEGRGERRKVSTLLLGSLSTDDWLLVFLNDAREKISAQRAEHINQALDLVDQALAGRYVPGATDADKAPEMPSAMSLEQINRLTGGT